MRYVITNRVATKNQINGVEPWDELEDNYVGDYIEAENGDEAITKAIWTMCEYAKESGFTCEVNLEEQHINFYRHGIFQCRYYGFNAREVQI